MYDLITEAKNVNPICVFVVSLVHYFDLDYFNTLLIENYLVDFSEINKLFIVVTGPH